MKRTSAKLAKKSFDKSFKKAQSTAKAAKKKSTVHIVSKKQVAYYKAEKEGKQLLNKKIKNFIRERKITSFDTSWDNLFLAYNKCMAKVPKVKFTDDNVFRSLVKRIDIIKSMEDLMLRAVTKQDKTVLFYGIRDFISWYNNKNK